MKGLSNAPCFGDILDTIPALALGLLRGAPDLIGRGVRLMGGFLVRHISLWGRTLVSGHTPALRQAGGIPGRKIFLRGGNLVFGPTSALRRQRARGFPERRIVL